MASGSGVGRCIIVCPWLPLATPSVGDNGDSKFERTGDHHFTIITQTNQPAEIFHRSIFI